MSAEKARDRLKRILVVIEDEIDERMAKLDEMDDGDDVVDERWKGRNVETGCPGDLLKRTGGQPLSGCHAKRYGFA